MSQPGLFGKPVVDMDRLPISGNTPQARHSSYTGAQKASAGRAEFQVRYLSLFNGGRVWTDQQAAQELGCDVSSINSTRNGCHGLIEAAGSIAHTWPDGSMTRRTLWRRTQ